MNVESNYPLALGLVLHGFPRDQINNFAIRYETKTYCDLVIVVFPVLGGGCLYLL